jgi:hypothetical protein
MLPFRESGGVDSHPLGELLLAEAKRTAESLERFAPAWAARADQLVVGGELGFAL